VKGGFFLRKKPLECVVSVYTNSENAIAGCADLAGLISGKSGAGGKRRAFAGKENPTRGKLAPGKI